MCQFTLQLCTMQHMYGSRHEVPPTIHIHIHRLQTVLQSPAQCQKAFLSTYLYCPHGTASSAYTFMPLPMRRSLLVRKRCFLLGSDSTALPASTLRCAWGPLTWQAMPP